jgi:hypothetical protein
MNGPGPGLDRQPEHAVAADALGALVAGRSAWLAATATRLHHLPFVTGAWLVGSLGRSTADAYSDIDLVVAVDPATSPPALLADPVAGLDLPGRLLFTRPKPRNAPTGGTFASVCVELAGLPVLVDLYLWPSTTAAVPAGAQVLDSRAGTARSDLDFMALLDRHRTTDTTGADPHAPATTLMLVQLAAKYLARADRTRLSRIAGQLRLADPVDAPALHQVLDERVDLDAQPGLRPAVDAARRLLALAETTGEPDIVLRGTGADTAEGPRDEPGRRWLRPLPGGRNNHVYAWDDPHARPCCVKVYRVDDRRRAEREWAALRLLAEHRFPRVPRPLWVQDGRLPVIGMTLLPGTPLADTDDPLSALAGLAQLTAQLQQVPLSGLLAELDRIDDLDHYLRRITEVWPRQLAEHADDPLTAGMRELLDRWAASGDREILARPDRVVLSRGDANLCNWLDAAEGVGCVDFEFAGHSTPSFDAADHLEHISAAAITDQQWQPLLPLLGVTDTNHDRFRAARRVCALRWLAILWRRRDQRAAEFHRQHARIRCLLTQPGS